MKTIEVYDPAMCCSTGVCGPAPDEALAAFAGAIEKIKSSDVSVTRYNLAQDPQDAAALRREGDSRSACVSAFDVPVQVQSFHSIDT